LHRNQRRVSHSDSVGRLDRKRSRKNFARE
jgi:hypothetical protein